MGRHVRKVPANWKHPKNEKMDEFVPLLDGYAEEFRKFLEITNSKGLEAAIDWMGRCPDKDDYMPEWPEEEKTHYMMYETTSEGTPISPAFPTEEDLARWLADTGASSFADRGASYEEWLNMIKIGSAPSAITTGDGVIKSGVEALSRRP